MAVIALHAAATGLNALSTEIDIIANNLANVNTPGFKSLRANFEDLLYEAKEQPGVENANGDQRPAGLFVGLGTRISNTQFDPAQGNAIRTDRPLDVMINGEGYFQVRTPDAGNGVSFTRAGNLFVNSNGQVVLGNAEGPLVEPGFTIDANATDIGISPDGIISGRLPGQTERSDFGQLELTRFINPAGLEVIGGNLLLETDASGPPISGNPDTEGFGKTLGKFLESSNVDPVKELVTMIKTQRAFELNSQTIQSADETLKVISNLRRF